MIGWSKLTRRPRDGSAFLLAPLVCSPERFMFVMSVAVTVFRTREVGLSVRRRGRRRGRSIGSLAVTTPVHSFSTRICGVDRPSTIPEGNGTAAGAWFGRLMHHGDAIVIQGYCYCTQDEESGRPARDP